MGRGGKALVGLRTIAVVLVALHSARSHRRRWSRSFRGRRRRDLLVATCEIAPSPARVETRISCPQDTGFVTARVRQAQRTAVPATSKSRLLRADVATCVPDPGG
jgi:hypothetical protein